MRRRGGIRTGALVAIALLLLGSLSLLGPRTALAGAFLFAGESNGVDVITHPPGYEGNPGVVDVTICVPPASPNATDMAHSLENAAATLSALTVTTGNLSSGGTNNVPSGQLDFESVLLHELGHCLGLAHPNLASESGLTGANLNYTKSTDGAAGYDLDRGADLFRGSADDLRGDDANLHWFAIADNNPFVMAGPVDTTTYSRQLSDLPGADSYAANGDRNVASHLGFPGTEAVMQQGTFTDEAQRGLTADDVATLSLGMAGVDETVGGGDDYTIQVVSLGESASCDIVIEFDDSETDFAQCNVTGTYLQYPDHIVIDTPRVYFNGGANWFFNPAPVVGCGSGTLDPGEACDDGGMDDGDGCDASCQLEVGWSCLGEPSVCAGICGDAWVVQSEGCDDGGVLGGDGCDSACTEEIGWSCSGEPSVCITTCGDGAPVGSEECDDGNAYNDDGCKNDCTIRNGYSCSGFPSSCLEVCGDLLIVGDEECDDGGVLGGDCCNSYCEFELSGSVCADDANACTDDECNGAGVCVHPANASACDDGDACTQNDQCAGGVCVGGALLDCDDGVFCNGAESCLSPVGCQPGSLDLDDGVACTIDGCDEATDSITHSPDDASCDDGVFCSGSEYCDPTLDCQVTELVVDDGVFCTLDVCDEVGVQVLHAPDHSMCDDLDACTANSCDALTGCASVPIEACDAQVPGLGAWARFGTSMILLTFGLLAVASIRRSA